jgi:lipoate-protein ligase A
MNKKFKEPTPETEENFLQDVREKNLYPESFTTSSETEEKWSEYELKRLISEKIKDSYEQGKIEVIEKMEKEIKEISKKPNSWEWTFKKIKELLEKLKK